MTRYSVAQRIMIVTYYYSTGESVSQTRKLFQQKFPGVSAPSKKLVREFVDEFPVPEDKATSLIRPEFRSKAQPTLNSGDKKKRMARSEWLLASVTNGFVDPSHFFTTGEARFYLNGYVQTEHVHYWSNDRQHAAATAGHIKVYPDEMDGLKKEPNTGVWCAVSGHRISDPFFFQTELTDAKYEKLLSRFYNGLTPLEKESMTLQLGDRGEECLESIKKRLFGDDGGDFVPWCPKSGDLSPCDFFLWEALQARVYEDRPATLEELENGIRKVVAALATDGVGRRIVANMLANAQKCLEARGGRFDHL